MLAIFIAIGFACPSHALIWTCFVRLVSRKPSQTVEQEVEVNHIPKNVILKLDRLFRFKYDETSNTYTTTQGNYLSELNSYIHQSILADGKPRYEVTDVLGAGGQGAVFRAFDRETELDVAIKVSETNNRSQVGIELAQRMHAKATKDKTDSPLLTVFDFNQGDDWSFTVSEWLPVTSYDNSLSHDMPLRTKRGYIFGELKEATLLDHVNALGNLAGAMQKIHNEGYIFTDLKPGNFTRLDNNQIKIMDLDSLAKLENGSVSLENGMVLITPDYASPELLALFKAKTTYGEKKAAAKVGKASDVYAFGLILNDTLEIMRANNFKKDMRLEAAIQHLEKSLVPKLLQVDPRDRPNMEDVQLELLKFQIIVNALNLEELRNRAAQQNRPQ